MNNPLGDWRKSSMTAIRVSIEHFEHQRWLQCVFTFYFVFLHPYSYSATGKASVLKLEFGALLRQVLEQIKKEKLHFNRKESFPELLTFLCHVQSFSQLSLCSS